MVKERNYKIGSEQVKYNGHKGKVQKYRCPSCGRFSVILVDGHHETCLNNCVSISLSRKLSIGG